MVSGQSFVIAKKSSGTRDIVEKIMDKLGVKVDSIEFGNTESVKKAVIAGMGISILSHHSVKNEVMAGQLRVVDISDHDLKRDL